MARFTFLHTADWHLGQTLHGVSRAYEHDRFLAWLLDRVEEHRADALVVAGDVFDVASPSADAQARYFGFLAEARRRFPSLAVVVVGGNHDGPARLDAARPVLDALGVRVVGSLSEDAGHVGAWDLDRLLVDLAPGVGLIALPYLRPKDLPPSRAEARRRAGLPPSEDDGPEPTRVEELPPLAEGHRLVYAALTEAAQARFGREATLIATGHAYVAGGVPSDGSERKVQAGNQQALPPWIFPAALRYVAMGHLHLAQGLGSRPVVRYPGSPIPLSMAELDYPHQVLRVQLDPSEAPRIAALRVPRAVELRRIPGTPAPLPEVVAALEALPRAPTSPDTPPEARPLIEARVHLERAEPGLRAAIEQAIDGAFARLVRIEVTRPAPTPAADPPAVELSQLSPADVFAAIHRRSRDGADPPPALLDAFTSLLGEIRGRGEPSG